MNTSFNDDNGHSTNLEMFRTQFKALLPRHPELFYKQPLCLAIQNQLNRSGLSDISSFDILSEVFLEGVKAIKSGKTIRRVDGWAYTVALNIISRKVSSKKPKELTCISYDSVINDNLATQSSEVEIDEAVESQYKKVREAMQRLNERDQELLELRVVNELSYGEIADYYGQRGNSVSPESLRQQKRRALKRLQSQFQ